jgi:hypothetical protein
LLCWLRKWRPLTHAAQELRHVQLGYFENQQGRMRYPEYLEAGWPIGGGAVEGACKHLVTDRFKGTGMRWNLEDGEAAAARACSSPDAPATRSPTLCTAGSVPRTGSPSPGVGPPYPRITLDGKRGRG